jgi:tellurite resistance protein
MIQVNTAAIAKLRDRLLDKGAPASVLMTGPQALSRTEHPLAGDDEAIALFDATFEAMFIMLASDGSIGQDERDVLRGAIRELTAGAVRTADIERLSAECELRSGRDGGKQRLQAVAGVLKGDRMAAEAAFVLAAAMAFADRKIADEENETLNELAELLDIDGDRANALLDQLEG